MNIFWRVYFAHLLCDFALQTEQLVKWKREKAWGLGAHVSIFFLVGALLTTGQLTKLWPTKIGLALPGWICLLILSVIHFLFDNSRIQVISWRGARTDNLYFFLLDQVLHLGTIYLFTAGGMIEKWVILGCLAVSTTYFMNIFLYYYERLYNENNKVKVYTAEKHYSLIERLIILLVLLLPGKLWLIVLVFLPLRIVARNIFFFNPQGNTFSPSDLGLNYISALICGILARIIYYA